MPTTHLISRSEEDTRHIGAQLAAVFVAGELVALRGLLGAGKSVLVRGMAAGLGISPRRVRSPTFTLINEYSGGRLPLFHLDLYRMQPSQLDRMALREYLYGDGVCVVEWWEHLGQNDCSLDIDITFVGTSERQIVVSSENPRYEAVLAHLKR
jgi:tRNA threonylcarbamoyladenosine biosynthesis protein TsaE